MQKDKYQDGSSEKTKHNKFSEKMNISYPLIRTCTCAYLGVRNARFFGKFGVLFFLVTSILKFVFLPYYRRPFSFTDEYFSLEVKILPLLATMAHKTLSLL